ncbi:molybdopterin-dependent oxidoreductase, partial [Nocardia asiatica]|uniref:molybdopterin-dependent oxidoreductase n=1 Tax=Nocardia asiatica TaxID=209252 RepID=UPI0012FBF413
PVGGKTTADLIALAARLGWMPSYPTFDRNPLDLTDEAAAAGTPVAEHVVAELKAGRLRFACEDPDSPDNFPRVLSVWRANLLGSSAKGNEYFLKHLLGTDSSLRAEEAPPHARPEDVVWHEQAPVGKLDLLLSLDFRMTSTTMFSDVVLPAATWYEKHDLSTTDMHPFIHSFNPAIAPPWQTRTDWAAFQTIAEAFSALAADHLGVRQDVVATPLLHDTPDELATPHGRVRDWKAGECEPVPGATMPRLTVVERDYTAIAAKLAALGPLAEKLGATTKGITYRLDREVEYLRHKNGAVRGGPADGRPSLAKDLHACEAILALSGTTNGHLATQGFRTLEQRTGTALADLAAEHEGKQITFADTQAAPVPVITSPEWSGSETGGRRYSPFTINVERLKPWHTLTGRQHFFLDHDWMIELGEQLPVFRPPLNMTALFDEPHIGDRGELGITVRYLTPHSKWSIHSEYQDNLFMLSLSRGGPTIWMSDRDAAKIGVADNDWIEAVNRNGVRGGARLFTAGDPRPVEAVLRRLAAMRSYMRDINLGREPREAIAAKAGMTGEQIYDMYRLLALAKYDERYVIPPAHAEQAHGLEELATECSLDYEGGPGMGGSGPFGESSGGPSPVAVENFRMLRDRQTTDTIAAPVDKGNRVNLLNWDGKGHPPGLFGPPTTPERTPRGQEPESKP